MVEFMVQVDNFFGLCPCLINSPVDCQGVSNVPEDFVAEQLKSVLSDMQVDVVRVSYCDEL